MSVTPRPESPYRGLSAFEDSELDALLFFGREREREIVVANLIASRLTVLYGPSGVGKSSLLGAAVARSLRELPEGPLVVVFSQWSEDPARALVEAVSQDAGVSNGSMLGVLERAQAGRDVYLVLDQAEEYFLYHDDDAGAESFAEQLPQVLAAPLRVNVLVSLRDDALAHLDRFTGRIPGLFANTLRLDRLDRPAARSAIVRPVERYAEIVGDPVIVEDRLVDLVLDAVEAGQIEPSLGGVGTVDTRRGSARVEAPYLQLVMQRIWEEERAAGSSTLRVSTLERLGGARRVVEEHLEGAVAELTPEQRDVAARLFNHLVTPSGTKIAHGISDLADFGGVSEADVLPVLTVLADRRILRTIDEGNVVRYEIFHDVLAQPVLAWRTRHRTERDVARQVEEHARRRSRARRLLGSALGLLAVLVAVVTFAIVQERNADQSSREARARELDAAAVALLTEDPELSLLLARESGRLAPSSTAEDALIQSLLSSHVRAAYEVGALPGGVGVAPDQSVAAYVNDAGELVRVDLVDGTMEAVGSAEPGSSVRFSPGGEFAVLRRPTGPPRVIDGTGSLRDRCVLAGLGGAAADVAPAGSSVVVVRNGQGSLWDATSCRLVRSLGPVGAAGVRVVVSPDGTQAAFLSGRQARIVPLRPGGRGYRITHPGEITSLDFSADGRRLVTGGRDRLARIWGRTGVREHELDGHRGQIVDVAFSPLATHVATASTDGTARIWSAETGELETPLLGHTDFVTGVDFSPDGSSVATASDDGTARSFALNGRLLAEFAGHDARVRETRFVGDGAFIVTWADDGTMRVWDTGQQPDLIPSALRRPPAPHTSATSEDGATAVAEGATITLERADGSTTDLVGHRWAVTSVDFSPDGERVVSAARDSEVILWDVRTGHPLRMLRGHFGAVSDARFSPDGRWIVTAGPMTVGLWRAVDGRPMRFLTGPEGPFLAAAFEPDSRTIVAVTDDGTIAVYDCRFCAGIPELLAFADDRLSLTGRELTADERALYGG